jgi:hypothetical protein
MKTITEFSGFTLKEAINKKAALLTEGKTEEEAQTAINEQLKLLDETKVSFYKNAVDMSKSRIDQVKRVVVAVKSTETEKVPEAFSEREGNFYLVEFFSQAGSMSRPQYDDRNDRGGRGGRGGGRDGGGRGNERGRGNDRGAPRGERTEYAPRAPRADRPAPSGGPSPFVVNPADPNFKPKHAPQGERKPRPPRAPKAPGAPRAPRPPRENQGPKGAAELRLVLKGQSQSTLQGSGPATAAPASEATSSDTQQG